MARVVKLYIFNISQEFWVDKTYFRKDGTIIKETETYDVELGMLGINGNKVYFDIIYDLFIFPFVCTSNLWPISLRKTDE